MPLLYTSFLGTGGGDGGGGGYNGWLPSALGATLIGWYRGDLLSGSDGDTITTWPDASGNGNNATESSVVGPELETAYLNGKNVVFFNAGGDFLTFPDMWSGKSAGSAFLLIKIANDPPPNTLRSGLWDIGSDSQEAHYPYNGDSQIYDEFGTNSRKTVGNPTPSLAAWRIYHVHSAANDWGAWIDGVSIFSTGTNTVGFTSTPRIGRSGGSASLDGHIADMILTDSKLSSTDREKVEGYLSHYWLGAGSANNLDSGHPYKSSPPPA